MGLIRLSDAIENLRGELRLAQEKGKNQNLQFSVGSIEVELEVVAEDETSASGKINWWIFGGGLDSKIKDSSKHRLKLTLQIVDDSGKPIRVSQEQYERPE
jgi:hypothetical protein